jgi:integrase
MFDQLFKRASTRARYVTAPFAEKRARYLDYWERPGMGSCHHSQRRSPPYGHSSATVPKRDGVRGIWQIPFKGREFMRRRDCQLAPRGQMWSGFFAGLDANRSMDVRDRAILMLFAIYGLSESEVAKLRLDDIDWEHDQLRIPRAKRREPQVYPLLPSVGRALRSARLA